VSGKARTEMSNRERRQGRREAGAARRRMQREYFEGEITAQTHHAFAPPEIHNVLTEFDYWLNEFDSDFATYVRRGGSDFIETHRLDGSWRHVSPGRQEAEGSGAASLKQHLAKADD
jgi:hypothetical protein